LKETPVLVRNTYSVSIKTDKEFESMNEFSKESKSRLLAGAKRSAEVQKLRKYQRIEEYLRNPVQCEECKCNLPYEKRLLKFCTRSCSVTQANRLRKTIKPHKCPKCETMTENKTFCSKACQGIGIKEDRFVHIEKTGSFFGCSNKKAREYLILKRGYQCEICHISEWLGKPISLVRDHINGNSDDERVENNRMICCNCDAQTPTYKSKNAGKGRATRRKRYAEGKSY